MATSGKFKVTTGHFGTTNEEELQQILEERNAKSTNKATKNINIDDDPRFNAANNMFQGVKVQIK